MSQRLTEFTVGTPGHGGARQQIPVLQLPKPFPEHVFGVDAAVEARLSDFHGAHDHGRKRGCLAHVHLEICIHSPLTDEGRQFSRGAELVFVDNVCPCRLLLGEGVSE